MSARGDETDAHGRALLRAIDMKKQQKKDAAYLAQRLDKRDIVGVASDTTAVMPAAIQRAGLEHIPCWAHVCNLMVKELYNALGMKDIMRWRAYLVSKPRVDALEARGLHPHALRVPSYRFAYWKGALRELLPAESSPTVWTAWEAYTASLDETAAARRRRKRAKRAAGADSDSEDVLSDDEYAESISKAASVLKQVMPTAAAKARAWLALQLTTAGADVIRVAEHNARTIPASTDAKLRAWLSFLEHTHAGSNTRDFITGCLTLTGVELTADEVDAVENDVTLGL